MKTSTKLALGLLAGAGISYGARRWIRSRRRIELAGRVVVITGASSGLGLLLARHAARRGARLALVARDAEALEQVALDLIAEGAPEALPIAGRRHRPRPGRRDGRPWSSTATAGSTS